MSLAELLANADEQVHVGGRIGASIWPTGLEPLDGHLGEVCAGENSRSSADRRGSGRRRWRCKWSTSNTVAAGRRHRVLYEHGARNLLERLIALEAATVAGRGSRYTIRQLREVFEDESARGGGLTERLAHLPGATGGLAAQRAMPLACTCARSAAPRPT